MALRHAYSFCIILRISHLFWITRWLWDMHIQSGQCWGYLTCFEQHDGFETCVLSLLRISHLFWTTRWLWDMRIQSGQCWGYLTCFEQHDGFETCVFSLVNVEDISPVLNNTMALRHAYSVWSMLRISHLFWTTRWLWDMRIQSGQCWGYLTCFEQDDGFETCVLSLVNVEDISPVLNNTMALRHAYSVWSMLRIWNFSIVSCRTRVSARKDSEPDVGAVSLDLNPWTKRNTVNNEVCSFSNSKPQLFDNLNRMEMSNYFGLIVGPGRTIPQFWDKIFQLFNYFLWLRITDEGSIP